MPLGIRLFFLDVVALASAEALKKIKKGWTIHSPEMKQQGLIFNRSRRFKFNSRSELA